MSDLIESTPSANVTQKPKKESKRTRFFISDFPPNTTAEELKTCFEKFGKIKNSYVMEGKNLGYVTFSGKHSVNPAKKYTLGGKHVFVTLAVKLGEELPKFKKHTRASFFIGDLPARATTKDVTDYFSKFGEIVDVKIIEGKNSAFVAFAGKHTCFLSEDAHSVCGRTVFVRTRLQKGETSRKNVDGTAKPFPTHPQGGFIVSNLPPNATEEDLVASFEKFGVISQTHTAVLSRNRNIGFVHFEGAHSCFPSETAHTVCGQSVIVRPCVARESGPLPPPHTLDSDSTKFYVRNLANGTTKAMLSEYFHQFGNVTEVELITQKGFGFVTFKGKHFCIPSKSRHIIHEKRVSVEPAIIRNDLIKKESFTDVQKAVLEIKSAESTVVSETNKESAATVTETAKKISKRKSVTEAEPAKKIKVESETAAKPQKKQKKATS